MMVGGRLGEASLLGLRSLSMGGMEKGRQRGIPRFINHSLSSNIMIDHKDYNILVDFVHIEIFADVFVSSHNVVTSVDVIGPRGCF